MNCALGVARVHSHIRRATGRHRRCRNWPKVYASLRNSSSTTSVLMTRWRSSRMRERFVRPLRCSRESICSRSRAHYGVRHFEAAAQTFETVAHTSTNSAADSFFNASLAWLQLSDHARFLERLSALGQGGGNEEKRAAICLIEEGLAQAAQGNKKAAGRCRSFCENFLVTGARRSVGRASGTGFP